MKKRLYLLTALFLASAALSLSSCLKDDSHYLDLSTATPVVEFNYGGLAYLGSRDAIQSPYAIDTIQFAVSVTTAQVPTTPTTIELAVDNSIITSYVAANPGIPYTPLPTTDYTLSTTKVQIPANQRVAIVTLYVNVAAIDPTQSYMLPIKIASTTGGYTISGNMSILYYHFIGNDFAGNYLWDYTRTPANGNFTGATATASPITPSEVQFPDAYYTGLVTYDFSFTKNGSGATATYTNLNVVLDAASVASQLTPNGISVTNAATFADPVTGASTGKSTLTGTYTYAQVVAMLTFTYEVVNSSGTRLIVDHFYK